MTAIIHAEHLFDGIHNFLLENVYVTFEDGKIVNMTSRFPSFSGRKEIITIPGGMTLMPGLIEAHDHPQLRDVDNKQEDYFAADEDALFERMVRYCTQALRSGVTTVRDCGASHHMGIRLSRLIGSKSISGPRIITCGNPLTIPRGHLAWMGREVDGIDQITKAIKEEITAGADFIKMTLSGGMASIGTDINSCQFSVDELRAAVDCAHANGCHIAGHAHSTKSIKAAVMAGFDTIEHCTWVGDNGTDYDQATVDEMVRRHITVVPTIATGYPKGYRKERWEKKIGSLEERIAIISRMLQSGVEMIVGTDDSIPDSLPYEMELMKKAGLDNFSVLQAATIKSAKRIGIGAVTGSIEVGKHADMIVVEGDPLLDIHVLNSAKGVVSGGDVIHMNFGLPVATE